jgi:hypothetical protein
MNTVWKWILGIVIALVVIAAIVAGVVLVIRTNPALTFGPGFANRFNAPNGQTAPNAPNNPNGPRVTRPGFGFGPGRGYNWAQRFGERGFVPYGGGFAPFGFMPFGMFFFFGGLLRLLIPIGVLVLVAFIFYQIGKQAGLKTAAAMPPANPPAPAAVTDNHPQN